MSVAPVENGRYAVTNGAGDWLCETSYGVQWGYGPFWAYRLLFDTMDGKLRAPPEDICNYRRGSVEHLRRPSYRPVCNQVAEEQ